MGQIKYILSNPLQYTKILLTFIKDYWSIKKIPDYNTATAYLMKPAGYWGYVAAFMLLVMLYDRSDNNTVKWYLSASSILIGFMAISVSAQLMRSEELEKYAKEKFGDKWENAAANIGSQLSLDKNNSLTYTQVIECGEQTKEKLYVTLNHWFIESFNDANSVIQLNDKEAGVIIGKGYVAGIAGHTGGMNAYIVSIHPIIKVDIKDKKIRVTYTVQCYDVEKSIGGGVMSAFSNGSTKPTLSNEQWALETCYPFVEKDAHKAKKTSSKALVMAHAYSNVIMDKIEEAVKNGLVGNESDNW